MTHYERLRVAPSATPQQIHDAYRRLAREAHPDRNRRMDAESRMAAINAAYRVLRDPARRREYDAEIAVVGTSDRVTSSRPYEVVDRDEVFVPPRDVAPARFPWKFMAVLLALGMGVIVIGLIFSKPGETPAPDNILRASDCVVLGPQLDASEVLCDEPHDAVVRTLVPFGDACPSGTEGYRDRQGMGTACVVRVTP